MFNFIKNSLKNTNRFIRHRYKHWLTFLVDRHPCPTDTGFPTKLCFKETLYSARNSYDMDLHGAPYGDLRVVIQIVESRTGRTNSSTSWSESMLMI